MEAGGYSLCNWLIYVAVLNRINITYLGCSSVQLRSGEKSVQPSHLQQPATAGKSALDNEAFCWNTDTPESIIFKQAIPFNNFRGLGGYHIRKPPYGWFDTRKIYHPKPVPKIFFGSSQVNSVQPLPSMSPCFLWIPGFSSIPVAGR